MKKKGIAVYVRVSSSGQDTRSQEPDLKAWARSNARGRRVTWYRDTFTGKTLQRPGIKKLEAAINAGDVETLAVWRSDRLGRTAREMLAFVENLDSLGVRFVSLRDGGLLDASTPAGKMFRHMLIGFAEYERGVLSERIRAGIARARSQGRRWGGRNKGVRPKLTRQTLRSIGTLLKSGTPKAEISRQLHIDRSTVYEAKKILRL